MCDQPEQILGRAIEALNSDSFPVELHHWLGLCCRFDNIAMLAFFRDRAPDVFYAKAHEARVFEKIRSDYVAGAYVLDPIFHLLEQGAPDGIYRLSDIAPDQFRRNKYYATYYEGTTLIDELVFFAQPADGVSIAICIGRDASSGRRFLARDLAAARALAPVVNALAKRHWHDLRAESEAPDAIADQLRKRLQVATKISLSPRQGEIALLILQGHSSVSIGLTLGISPQTVKVIRKQLYRKCEISSQAELFALLIPYLSSVN